MWPDRVSKPGPLALESDALPTALNGLSGTKLLAGASTPSPLGMKKCVPFFFFFFFK